MNKGIYYAVGAYMIWGLLPVYWKLLHHVPVFQLLAHRIVWSFVFLAGVLLVSRQQTTFWKAVKHKHVLRVYALSALLIAINWFIYVWAVSNGFVIQTSLGYFINPLVSVLIGVVVLREKLRVGQWFPVGVATIGVVYLTFAYGSLPWISLSLAVTWAIYGLVKKFAPLSSLYGLTVETGLLLLPATFYLAFSMLGGGGVFLHDTFSSDVLLLGTGIVTTTPLFLFALAVVRIPLSLTGILQYTAPTLQFLLGLFVFKETFTRGQFIGFSFIWLALILFAGEAIATRKRQLPDTQTSPPGLPVK
jgi:chloramphenicol-sensitive protein RarD